MLSSIPSLKLNLKESFLKSASIRIQHLLSITSFYYSSMYKQRLLLAFDCILKEDQSSTKIVTHYRHEMKYPRPLFFIFIFIFILISTFEFAASQPSATNCILDLHNSSSHFATCEGGNWGGFLLRNCCGVAFEGYLYALGQRANQTGQIFLNSTEQGNCLASMKSPENDVFSCGIERLTSGGGKCSDFSVADVNKKLGDQLKSLKENCKLENSHGDWDQSCGSCTKSWKDIGDKDFSHDKSLYIETDICRFSVLISLTSTRIADETWVHTIYQCLGDQDINNAAENQPSTDEGKNKTGLWILIGGLTGIAVVAVTATIIWSKIRLKSRDPPNNEGPKNLMQEPPDLMKVHIKEVYSATNNLNETNIIGEGTAGRVYKGILSNNQHVAVKHIINDGYVETFAREVTSLSHIRHPNLVALLAYCEEEDECFLVYELCPNGNLSEWIFGKDKVLSWIQRLEIAIDSARGLWFLHTYAEGCIVHRDIKPTNILLGMNFEAKLSDFGLSKVINQGESFVSSEVRGTFGYVDPEYQNNHHVNSSGDVYSFGIVLLQILSGKRVINMTLKKPMPLDKMAKGLTKGGSITEFADPKLDGEYSAEAFDLTLKLALSCTSRKQIRPSMEQVVAQLEMALGISTRGKFSTSQATRGRASTPQATPGRDSTPQATPGRETTHQATPGRGTTPQAIPGRASTAQATPGRDSTPQPTLGRETTHQATLGRETTPLATPGRTSAL